MKKLKKRFIVPVVVFILGMCALIGTIYVVGEGQEQQNRTNAKLNAMTYTERIYGELMEGIGVTDTLKQVVISGDGNVNKFYDIAENMMDDSIQSIQIAPNGVVNEIYPEDLNEPGKIDLINDSDRGEISRYARDNDTVIMQCTITCRMSIHIVDQLEIVNIKHCHNTMLLRILSHILLNLLIKTVPVVDTGQCIGHSQSLEILPVLID